MSAQEFTSDLGNYLRYSPYICVVSITYMLTYVAAYVSIRQHTNQHTSASHIQEYE
jgi:hypothetical protein